MSTVTDSQLEVGLVNRTGRDAGSMLGGPTAGEIDAKFPAWHFGRRCRRLSRQRGCRRRRRG